MLETKSLINSIKSGLYDDLLSSIDQEYLGTSMAPPAELVPYLQERKLIGRFLRLLPVKPAELVPYMKESPTRTEEEGKKIQQIYDGWTARTARALGRAKDATQQLKIMQEILNGLPEPFKTGVIEAVRKLAAK